MAESNYEELKARLSDLEHNSAVVVPGNGIQSREKVGR